VRAEVVLALVKVGPGAGAAVPALTEMQTNDPDPQVRGYAARALERLRAQQKKGR
jgi:HEAT repeat protein